ncbi:MAG: CRISPR-associated ring nuclease Csm6 [Acetobacteraceae bacterium]|nr:CRISPR-associated ring nuclease Csm6 [Acetobacteraceae bacterium]
MARGLHLLALAGLSPQVVTETVWCLAKADPPRIPQRITVLTTGAGRSLGEGVLPGALARLAAQLGQALPRPEWRILAAPGGEPLEDIATDADNRIAADAILAEIAAATLDPETDLHVSLAGGRKTMGALAALSLSLCGRETDVLSHVLVDPRFQGRPDFFFPPDPPESLVLEDGTAVSTADAALTLAEIPFVRLRSQWRPAQEHGPFAETVRAVQQRLMPPRLELDVSCLSVRVGPQQLRLPPSLFGTLWWFAERCRTGAPPVAWRTGAEARALGRSLLSMLERAGGQDIAASRQALGEGLERTYLAEKVSRLNRRFREALGPAAEPFLIRAEGRRPLSAYRLALPPEAILITGGST